MTLLSAALFDKPAFRNVIVNGQLQPGTRIAEPELADMDLGRSPCRHIQAQDL